MALIKESNTLIKESNTNGFTREYEYDINNNTNGLKYTLSNKVNRVKYNYDNVNRLKDIKLNDNITWENGYDSLSRVGSKKIVSGSNNYTTTYTYKDLENVENKTTTLLSTIQNGNNESTSYTYDALGNIETIKKGNKVTNQYYYDELNQLVKEINIPESKMITYEYDEGGNILSKKEYFYYSGSASSTPSETITYTYGNTNWRDQLTSYNGKTITYDEIGNIVTYNGNTYTWQNGRQLAGIRNSSQTITYKYNDSGIRTQKTVNGTVTNYYLDGTKVIYEKTGNNVIYYTYDENGNIIGLNYNNTQYYYIRNGQNDVIGILDSNLNQVVSYEYDSWGNTISIKDASGNDITSSSNIGIINPYRYRSYRYDTETGLYYLNSRYYNPEWGRFINFDNYGGQVGELLSHNGYAYCMNNPINREDENGHFWSNVWNTIKSAWNSYWDWIDKPKRQIAANMATRDAMSIVQATGRYDKYEEIYNLSYNTTYNALCISTSYVGGVSNVKPKVTTKKVSTKTKSPIFDSNQRVVIELAKEAKKSGGITMQNAKILVQWGKEYNVINSRFDLNPVKGKLFGNTPHIHINNYHIKLIP